MVTSPIRDFLKYKKIYFVFSGILILGSLISLIVFGLKLGIDFTGGSILEIEYRGERPESEVIRKSLGELDLRESLLQPVDEKGVILRMKDVSEATHQKILESLKTTGQFEQRRFESIGPVIGKELRGKTKILIVLSLLAIILYISLAFRKVSYPLLSWQYGLASLLALFHDILIPIGIFSILGKFYGVQVTIPVVVALLTVLGYSVNNTVVVFDRIREILLTKTNLHFGEVINRALSQTLTRQINTSLTTLFILTSIFFFGGETLRYFALALILGLAAGTYSSIFLVTPILVSWLNWRKAHSLNKIKKGRG